MSLYTLVYVSIATRDMTDEDLLNILNKAREKNARLGVTGMLLYRDNYFIQALEGEKDTLLELYATINADERHEKVLTVYQHPIEKRTFSDWAMGFNRLDNIDPASLPGFTDFLTQPFDLSFLTDNPSRAKLLLESFKEQTYF